MEISVHLSNQELHDQFTTAMDDGYGGSLYWGRFERNNRSMLRKKHLAEGETPIATDYLWKAILAGETVIISDVESDDTWELTLEKVKKGTEIFAKNSREHYGDAVGGHGDSTTADVWFQSCVLGEVTFG